jgi:hypothetical protein
MFKLSDCVQEEMLIILTESYFYCLKYNKYFGTNFDNGSVFFIFHAKNRE